MITIKIITWTETPMFSLDGYSESKMEVLVNDLEMAIDMMKEYIDDYINCDRCEYTRFRYNQKEMGAYRDDFDNDISYGIRIQIIE